MSPPEAAAPLTTVAAFAAAIADADRPVPPGVRVEHGDLASRFAVYRNNVWVARLEVLDALFPVARRLVGDDFFRTLGRRFFVEAAPRNPVAHEWAEPFAVWLAASPAGSEWPWLVDVARLEAAWTRAHHAAEAVPIGLVDLARLAPEALAAGRLTLHPSTALIASAFPIGSIWAAHQGDDDPAPLAVADAETVLVVRPDADVVVAVLTPGEAVLVGALGAGATVAEASEAALAADPDLDVGARLVALVRLGAVIAVTPPDVPLSLSSRLGISP